MEQEKTEDAGVIESIEKKVTKNKGKPYVSYRINGQVYNDFNNKTIKVKVGDKVSFSYSIQGRFKNLLNVEALAGGGSSNSSSVQEEILDQKKVTSYPSSDVQGAAFSAPFLGMCSNQAIQLIVSGKVRFDDAVVKEWTSEVHKRLVKILYTTNSELQDELKNVKA